MPYKTDTESRDPVIWLSCCMLPLLLSMQCMEAEHTVPVSAYRCQLGPVSLQYLGTGTGTILYTGTIYYLV